MFQIITKLQAARFQHILAANPPEITDELSLKVDFTTDHIVMEYLFPILDVDEWGELIRKRFALPTAMGGFGKLSLLDRGPCAYWITIEKTWHRSWNASPTSGKPTCTRRARTSRKRSSLTNSCNGTQTCRLPCVLLCTASSKPKQTNFLRMHHC